MDELDVNLLDAWGRVVEELRGDRALARARWRRSRGVTVRRPMRAWCLSLRAADTRITSWNACISDPQAVVDRIEHTLELDGRTIRELCGPVGIPWPGVKLREAAAMLGRHPEALRHWLPKAAHPGRSRGVRAQRAPARYEEVCEPGSVLSVRYEAARSHGHKGMDVPVVWSDRLLNPGAVRGSSPHALWGTMWEGMGGCIPDGYVLRVSREPRVRPYPLKDVPDGGRGAGYRGRGRFRGWEWVCPGRVDLSRGEHVACGRRVQTLYLPLPVFSIARWLGDEEGIEVASDGYPGAGGGFQDGVEDTSAKPQAAWGAWGGLRIRGRWYPGVEDPQKGYRSFACGDCWGVRCFSICDYRGWNDFVSHLSGGLLLGREVRRPRWLRYERKYERVQGSKGAKEAKPQALPGGDGGGWKVCWRSFRIVGL